MAEQEAQRSFKDYPPRNGWWKVGVWIGKVVWWGPWVLGLWKVFELFVELILWIYGN